jgi:hypothetical protein
MIKTIAACALLMVASLPMIAFGDESTAVSANPSRRLGVPTSLFAFVAPVYSQLNSFRRRQRLPVRYTGCAVAGRSLDSSCAKRENGTARLPSGRQLWPRVGSSI